MGLVKTLDIPTYILNFFNLQENLELLEYIIAGIFGLVSRLGFKGLIEGIFLDNYATMGGEDPIQGSISGSQRFTSIYGNLAKHLSEEMEVLSVSMNEAKSDDE